MIHDATQTGAPCEHGDADGPSTGDDSHAARIRLALEAVTSLRAAQAPCEGEGEVDSIDHAAIGAALRAFAAALAELAPGLAAVTTP